jgi:RHS repeat-associated protein
VSYVYDSDARRSCPTTQDPQEEGKYSWLGSIELPTELPSGVTTMGARSYVPQIGRFLQPDPIPGGSANAYSYTFGDPINTTDPTGAYTATASKAAELAMALYGQGIAAQRNAEHRQREAAEKVAAELAAEAAAQAAAAAAAAAADFPGASRRSGETGPPAMLAGLAVALLARYRWFRYDREGEAARGCRGALGGRGRERA